MKHARQTRFDRKLEIRAPDSLTEALDVIADRNLTSRSNYIRSALIDRLRADGVEPARLPAPLIGRGEAQESTSKHEVAA